MSNKETVQTGLDARKNVRAAEARAAQAQQAAAEANDERIYEQMQHQRGQQALKKELADARTFVQSLLNEIEAMRVEAQAREKIRTHLLGELAKAVAAIVLIYTIRDLDLVVSWLANSLIVASELYLVIQLVKLRKQK